MMEYRSLLEYISALENAGELIRIKEKVSTDLEITEITDRMCKAEGGGKALFFENTPQGIPVLMNSMGSYKRMSLALGTDDLDEIGAEIEDLFKMLTAPKEKIWDKLKMLPQLSKVASWMPKVVSGKGKCQDIVYSDPDLSVLPVLKTWPSDGGPFITFPMVITKDPVSGIRNVGMYRMQVMGKAETGMHWHKHKVGARHYEEYKKLGQKMPVAVAIGGDPAHTFSATAPLPDNVDEFMLSAFLRKKKVELVKCLTNELEVPADADFVLEGYIDPQETLAWEGPFGDHTGFYSLPDYYPRFHITCITSRKNPVYPATIVGVPPMEDAYIQKASERIFLAPIKLAMLPEVVDMDMPDAGVAHNLVVVSIDKTFAGQGSKVASSMWGAGQMMFNKILVVVDKLVDVHNYMEVAKAISANVDPAEDVTFGKGPLDVLDHSSSKYAFGGKMLIDATSKYAEETAENSVLFNQASEIDFEAWKECCPELLAVNCSLLKDEVAFVAVSFQKNEPKHVQILAEKLQAAGLLNGIKGVLFVDELVDPSNLFDAFWVAMNNMDPRRDNFVLASKNGSCLIMDGSRKTNAEDGFVRDWPNVVASSEEIIKLVDEKWDKYGIGEFIPSPSLKYRKMLLSENAFAEKNRGVKGDE